MYILAIETTGPNASVALINEEGRMVETVSQSNFSHLKQLMPMIDLLLLGHGIEKEELSAVAASMGPGSFTGIRIGVSTARALAQALEIPCVAVSTLKAFAYNDEVFEGLICPVFDARRSQVYAAAYEWRDGEIAEVVAGGAYIIDEFLSLLSQNREGKACKFFGDGREPFRRDIEAWAEKEGASVTFAVDHDELSLQRASSVANLALDMYKAGQTVGYNDFLPDYMRRPEAERNLEAGKLGKRGL